MGKGHAFRLAAVDGNYFTERSREETEESDRRPRTAQTRSAPPYYVTTSDPAIAWGAGRNPLANRPSPEVVLRARPVDLERPIAEVAVDLEVRIEAPHQPRQFKTNSGGIRG
jgi:hypothetical protein